MELREISKSLMQGPPEARRRGFSRRSVLSLAGAFGAAAPFGIFGAARAVTPPPYIPGESLICRPASS
jgi:NitT/TauT family transport system substrate-binding protein